MLRTRQQKAAEAAAEAGGGAQSALERENQRLRSWWVPLPAFCELAGMVWKGT